MQKNRRRSSAQESAARARQIGRSRYLDTDLMNLQIRRMQSADDKRLSSLVSEPKEISILTSGMILCDEAFYANTNSAERVDSLTRQGKPIEEDDFGNALYK